MISAAQGLALTRIAVGGYFLSQAVDKTRSGWLADGTQMAGFIQQALARAESVYSPFLETTVLPNASLFAQLVTVGEWGVGTSLTLGLFTRLGALAGIAMVMNYMLMKGLANNFGSNDRLFAVACLAFFLASAGMTWGLDGWLAASLRQSPLTRWAVTRPGR